MRKVTRSHASVCALFWSFELAAKVGQTWETLRGFLGRAGKDGTVDAKTNFFCGAADCRRAGRRVAERAAGRAVFSGAEWRTAGARAGGVGVAGRICGAGRRAVG